MVGFAYPGDLIGVGIHYKHPPNIQAIIPSVVRCMPKPLFLQSATQDHRFAFKLYEGVSMELRAAQNRALEVGQHTPEERLGAFLLGLSRRNEQRGEDPAAIALPMPRSDIADYLGLTTETVCRTFTKFKQRGLIALRHRRSLRVLDRDALHALAPSDGTPPPDAEAA